MESGTGEMIHPTPWSLKTNHKLRPGSEAICPITSAWLPTASKLSLDSRGYIILPQKKDLLAYPYINVDNQRMTL